MLQVEEHQEESHKGSNVEYSWTHYNSGNECSYDNYFCMEFQPS